MNFVLRIEVASIATRTIVLRQVMFANKMLSGNDQLELYVEKSRPT